MRDLADLKAAARGEAFARRKAAYEAAAADPTATLREVLAAHRGKPLSGYMRMRTEIDPTAAMAEAADHGPVGVPIIDGKGLPLRFREWTPGCALEPGTFGAAVPAGGAWIVPEVLIVPLLAFDRRGFRLGYGGGFYDRTLPLLRSERPVFAIGFAFAAQEMDEVPADLTDAHLELIVTERDVIEPSM